jgi:hypothetical protein
VITFTSSAISSFLTYIPTPLIDVSPLSTMNKSYPSIWSSAFPELYLQFFGYTSVIPSPMMSIYSCLNPVILNLAHPVYFVNCLHFRIKY